MDDNRRSITADVMLYSDPTHAVPVGIGCNHRPDLVALHGLCYGRVDFVMAATAFVVARLGVNMGAKFSACREAADRHEHIGVSGFLADHPGPARRGSMAKPASIGGDGELARSELVRRCFVTRIGWAGIPGTSICRARIGGATIVSTAHQQGRSQKDRSSKTAS